MSIAEKQIPTRAVNIAKNMHDAAVTAFCQRYPRWYVAERMNKPTAFAGIPEDGFEGKLFWNSLRMFFMHAKIKVREVPGVVVRDKTIDGHTGKETRILFLDNQGERQILCTFKAGDYFRCDIVPAFDFFAQEPLVDEKAKEHGDGLTEALMNTTVGDVHYKRDTASIKFTSRDGSIVCVYDMGSNKLFINMKHLEIKDKIFEMFMQAMNDAALIGRRYGFMEIEARLRSDPPSFLTTLIVYSGESKPQN